MSGGGIARKAVHIAAGLPALLVPFLTWWQGLLCCAGGLALNALLLPMLTRRRLERDDDRSRGYAAGIVLYPIGVALLFLLFGSRPAVVGGAWGILAFGDGFATLAGRLLGGPRLPWNRDKTVTGLVAFVVTGSAAGAVLGWWAEPAGSQAGAALPLWAFVAAAV